MFTDSCLFPLFLYIVFLCFSFVFRERYENCNIWVDVTENGGESVGAETRFVGFLCQSARVMLE